MAETEKPNLKEQVALLPLSPGVYQFVDRSGTIIYVGKAKSLRKRVSSYFVQSTAGAVFCPVGFGDEHTAAPIRGSSCGRSIFPACSPRAS